MPPTLREQIVRHVTATLLLAALPLGALADAYGDARAELVAAYQAGDFAAMRAAAQKSLDARPGYPGALFNRALAEVLDGDSSASLATLAGLAGRGVHFGVESIEAFAPLQQHPDWTSYASLVARLDEPRGDAVVAYTLPVADFVPEGIAVAADGTAYLGSIRHGTIVRIGESAETLSKGRQNGHWSVFGMRLADGALWFTSAAVPQYLHATGETAGRSGLFRLDLASGDITRAALLPQVEGEQVLGDLVIAGDRIYTTDSINGHVYEYSITDDVFSIVVDSGVFGSPQGLVLDKSGEHLYVADYTGGLFRVRIADGGVERVQTPEAVSDYGIDGLYRRGNTLVWIQNGVRPHRVAALELDDEGRSGVEARLLAVNLPEFDEPTLGTIAGGRFYFVANSHWNRFDRDNDLPADLSGPIILGLELPQPAAGSR
jgi:hypothetical protein